MKKKVLAFGASNSRNSINKKFAAFAGRSLEDVELSVVDLNDFELPLYSFDLERETGVHDNAIQFFNAIKQSDAVIISLAEYNGLHTSAFKNLWDWMSRIDNMNIWSKKPMLLLSTSPSKRPESNVINVSRQLFPYFGANIIASYHLPSFNHFFSEDGIIDEDQRNAFDMEKKKFQEHLNNLN